MRLLIVSFLMLQVNCLLFSQKDYDEVRIYFYSEYLTSGIGGCGVGNENDLRVNSSIKIFITDKNEIDEIANQLTHSDLDIIKIDENFRCQMVIDFVKSARIVRTVAISPEERIRLDEDVSYQYGVNNSISAFYSNYLKFFRTIYPADK